MTITIDRPTDRRRRHRQPRRATGLLGWLTTTDHKHIGISYMVTAFALLHASAARWPR